MTINARTVSAGEALKTLKEGARMQREHGIKMSYMLHGAPGIGKTQIVEELARSIGGPLYDIRLTQIDVSDLRGLPYYNHETKTTEYYRPEDLPSERKPAVLFLDEITAAPPHLQPSVYGLLQERRCGMHKIPDDVIIVAAGNTIDDGAVAYEMPTATADRLTHMFVKVDAEDWLKGYAIPNNLHPAVMAFIRVNPGYLDTAAQALKDGLLIATTPRSVTRCSDILYHCADRDLRKTLIAGNIGEAMMTDLMVIAEDVASTMAITEMVTMTREKRLERFPTNLYGLNALVMGLLSHAKPSNMTACIEILADLGNLSTLRNDPELKQMPLAELATYGFENFIGKMMEEGQAQALLDDPTFKAYSEERERLGLA